MKYALKSLIGLLGCFAVAQVNGLTARKKDRLRSTHRGPVSPCSFIISCAALRGPVSPCSVMPIVLPVLLQRTK